ncbi:hypothetical protein ACJIZ3_000763 [Penstemon smallii]|uniref:RING-type domain-containing protein n=1 Tax=Penstemon smallii TaxID=265156 RepID=A0ABD3U2Z0_9LAMI
MAIEAKFYSENLGFVLGGPQDSLMENAFGFNNFNVIAQPQLMQFQNSPLQTKQRFLLDNSINGPIDFSQSISSHIQKQSMEIDRFISLQNERLRFALQEQRKQQIAVFLKKYESKTQFLLSQKEEEITNAKNRAMELEQFIKRIEIENQTWQSVARENEAMVASLNSTIERLRETVYLSGNAADDAESCCEINQEGEEKTENEEQRTRKMVICRCCNARKSCVIMLPCRHLCSCKDCDAFLDFCPVCSMVKKDSIEAFLI